MWIALHAVCHCKRGERLKLQSLFPLQPACRLRAPLLYVPQAHTQWVFWGHSVLRSHKAETFSRWKLFLPFFLFFHRMYVMYKQAMIWVFSALFGNVSFCWSFRSWLRKNPCFVEFFLEAPHLPKQKSFERSKSDLPKLMIHGWCCNTAGMVYLDIKS